MRKFCDSLISNLYMAVFLNYSYFPKNTPNEITNTAQWNPRLDIMRAATVTCIFLRSISETVNSAALCNKQSSAN